MYRPEDREPTLWRLSPRRSFGIVAVEKVRELTHLLEQPLEVLRQATALFAAQRLGIAERGDRALERDERGFQPGHDVESFPRFRSRHVARGLQGDQRMPIETPITYVTRSASLRCGVSVIEPLG